MDDIIDRERLWLEPLKKVNDIYIDTSGFSVNQLKKQLDGLFSKDSKIKLNIRIISFGYKYGLPREADIVFDMRFIKNPFYIKELSKLNGKNKTVVDFINKQKNLRRKVKIILLSPLDVLGGFTDQSFQQSTFILY